MDLTENDLDKETGAPCCPDCNNPLYWHGDCGRDTETISGCDIQYLKCYSCGNHFEFITCIPKNHLLFITNKENEMRKSSKVSDFLRIMEAAEQYVGSVKVYANCPEAIANIMRPILHLSDHEELWTVILNSKKRVISLYQVSKGLMDSAPSHAREVFREAIVNNACSIILVHNHPSGDPAPSGADTMVTRTMAEAGRILGIAVEDHVIIGSKTVDRQKDFFSFLENGML